MRINELNNVTCGESGVGMIWAPHELNYISCDKSGFGTIWVDIRICKLYRQHESNYIP